jgi:hypothetical protein
MSSSFEYALQKSPFDGFLSRRDREVASPSPIRFRPVADERGLRAIRFEGRWDLDAVFAGVVTRVASATGVVPECRRQIPGEVPAAGAGKAA